MIYKNTDISTTILDEKILFNKKPISEEDIKKEEEELIKNDSPISVAGSFKNSIINSRSQGSQVSMKILGNIISVAKDKKLEKEVTKENKEPSNKILPDYDFNFIKDYLTILVPNRDFKLCNLYKSNKYDYDRYRNRKILNIFIFSEDITLKDLCISGCSANYELDSLDVTLYESKYNPKDYLIEGSNDLQRKYYIDSINDTLMWENQKVLMENKNLVIENSLPNKAEAGKLGKILNESYVLNTKGIMLKKDKIYAFLFSINDNYNGNYIYYIKKYENYHYKRIKKELDVHLFTNYNGHYLVFGFNYRMDLEKVEDF